MSGLKKHIFRIVAILLGIGMVWLLGELALRIAYAADQARGGNLQERLERSRQRSLDAAGGEFSMSGMVQASPFPDIVYELKPNLAGTFRSQSFQSSAQGLRDQAYSVDKPPNTFRIVGLGDSVMFGWGVNQGECYLDLLEQRLNDQPGEHPRFEVLNFALPGYNTSIEVAAYEHKAQPFSPDLVVIQFVNNDFGAPIFMYRPRDVYSLNRSYFLEFLNTRFNWWRQGAGSDLVANRRMNDLEDEEAGEIISQYHYMAGEEGFRRAMSRLAELTRPRGIPVIIIRGTSSEEQKAIINDVAGKHGFRVAEITPYTDRYVAAHGIENTRQARRKALWVSPGDHHPNARAHTIYVDALMDQLRALGVVTNGASSG